MAVVERDKAEVDVLENDLLQVEVLMLLNWRVASLATNLQLATVARADTTELGHHSLWIDNCSSFSPVDPSKPCIWTAKPPPASLHNGPLPAPPTSTSYPNDGSSHTSSSSVSPPSKNSSSPPNSSPLPPSDIIPISTNPTDIRSRNLPPDSSTSHIQKLRRDQWTRQPSRN
ncbi:hypothetical protein M9H77_07256 [Catharanthus roseus]|uniref:Uncharacterized protein n=1 Tax=Catharanthus roseus TaxID=4058 RepID=A0ACC0BUG4_CATRO|nr:hypothetical protein M9H77_07256 [Catharanthus roseus]